MDDKKQKYINLLKKKLDEADKLKEVEDRGELNRWKNEISMILDNLIANPESKYIKQFNSVSYSSGLINRNPQLYRKRDDEAYKNGIDEAKSIIKSIIFGVEEGLI